MILGLMQMQDVAAKKVSDSGKENAVPLGLLESGAAGEVLAVFPGKHCAARLEDMGFRAGKRVDVLNNGHRGPLLIKIDESRIALGRGMAMSILVRRT